MMAVRPPADLADIVIQDAAKQGLSISDMAVLVLAKHYGYQLPPEQSLGQQELPIGA